jgi:hypothetical protein
MRLSGIEIPSIFLDGYPRNGVGGSDIKQNTLGRE